MITVDACCCGCTLKQGCLFYGYWVIIVEIITWILWMIFLDFIVIFYALFYGLVYILGGIFLLCAIYKHKRNLMIVSMLITALYCVTLVATLLGIPWSSFLFHYSIPLLFSSRTVFLLSEILCIATRAASKAGTKAKD
ncbi:uncharacterized protein LOC115624235 isoform X2 [Scaptodrosophila lebanonensis]|uniref:Uncharacterized protein LOC115624235 isoform X2 n=1 Tax=Drosophila lebanonensis TaxID=7225 RepID=A0A6J2TGX7_DROLE|nr:uncharacterized protein LOC115624235 isoform X2 [Scaptodrosophila lebanonensis]